MTETPDERRERIDGARREQADLHREIGQEFSALTIRPSAAQAWEAFQESMARGREAEPQRLPKCQDRPERYSDYDPFNVPSPAKAAMLCFGCPFSTKSGDGTCGTYAEAEKPNVAVWDGRVYGRDQAERDRKEIIRKQKEEA